MKRIIKYALYQSFFYSSLITLVAAATLLGFSDGGVYVILIFPLALLLFFGGTIVHWYIYKKMGREKDYWDDEEYLD